VLAVLSASPSHPVGIVANPTISQLTYIMKNTMKVTVDLPLSDHTRFLVSLIE
jgi:hypothetical protein